MKVEAPSLAMDMQSRMACVLLFWAASRDLVRSIEPRML
jgi:hypothetical protein